MKAKINEMRQERAGIWEQAKALNEKALNENRDFTAEEQAQYDKMMSDMESKKNQIDRMEAALRTDEEMSASGGSQFRQPPSTGTERVNARATPEYRAAFERFLVDGISALSPETIKGMASDPDSQGGYLVTPQQFVTELLKEVDNMVFIRQFARGFQLKTAKSLGVPTLDGDVDDADWTTELRTGNETDITLGKRELRPHPLAKRAKVSNTLLRQTAGGAEALVRERLSYKFGVTLEKAYMYGDGNSKPLGLFVPSNDGIPTSRDVVGANTATAIKADTLIDALYGLKQNYQGNARWGFHRDVLKEIRKLKDANGQYLWAPGIAGGQPDTILSKPFFQSEYAPNDISAGKYIGIIGDFRYYWYVDALDFAIQRLVELYAETNQTGFIGRYEGDGQPVLGEAFVRIKMG
ncbi:phage major capsid protein [Paenibacillus ginsengarvi]|uniref:Phage major capsid protein n=1 Tax=Paenibacillus ginsengarvi TaxID=400777 RepID=A0A3B0CV52_9BACL|nr:phage major capsid protein [Paenibacillus ginsengarvi]RKN86749.1 phage major capsid protein [Paenibacillus ginsengarvi]